MLPALLHRPLLLALSGQAMLLDRLLPLWQLRLAVPRLLLCLLPLLPLWGQLD
jgi:hypothetical protein